jgi:thioesterase domain-containing protein
MDPAKLTKYLHEHIPISAAMQAVVTKVSSFSVTASSPLPPNINHRDTMFGGSLSALAILAGWGLVRVGSEPSCADHMVVIQKSEISFHAPANDTVVAVATVTPETWDRFIATVARHGRGRVKVEASLTTGNVVVATFEGTYAVLPR